MAECEKKDARKVDEDTKILALKSIMPETLFGEVDVFRGRSFNLYVDLRAAIINYVDDKVPVSMMKQGPSVSTTNMVQNLTTGDQGAQGEDEEVKNEVPHDEIFAMVQQFRKGEGKGKGMKGACWNCGKNDHYSRDCRNDKQDNSWTDDGMWKNQEESGRQQDRQKCRRKVWRAGN